MLHRKRQDDLSGVELPIDDTGSTSSVDLWKSWSVFEGENGIYFYLHPELVQRPRQVQRLPWQGLQSHRHRRLHRRRLLHVCHERASIPLRDESPERASLAK